MGMDWDTSEGGGLTSLVRCYSSRAPTDGPGTSNTSRLSPQGTASSNHAVEASVRRRIARWDAAPQDDEDTSDEGEEKDRGDEAARGAFLEEEFAGEESEGALGA